MTTSVSLSTRVSPELRERLLASARAQKVPLSELARGLLAAGVDGGPRPSGDGALVNEVECVFSGLGPEAGVYREVCLALARTAEAGGSPGVTAGRELLSTISLVEMRFAPEDDDEDEGLTGE
jgi:hypothetical protein